MTLADLAVKSEYRSDADDFVGDFYLPCLSHSVDYRRAVGYFTSRGLAIASQGITALIHNGGGMSLVACPVLSREDQDAIKKGYAARDDIIQKSLLRGFDAVDGVVEERRLGYLAWLVSENRLEIRIALPISEDSSPRSGIYHEKLGIFRDSQGNSIAFTGSPNETFGGLVDNFETIDVFCSWDDPQNRVVKKQEHFHKLWENRTSGLKIMGFPEAVRQRLLRFRPPKRPELEGGASKPHRGSKRVTNCSGEIDMA
jgi:hypothetical protein